MAVTLGMHGISPTPSMTGARPDATPRAPQSASERTALGDAQSFTVAENASQGPDEGSDGHKITHLGAV